VGLESVVNPFESSRIKFHCLFGQLIWPSSILTSPVFFAIMPEFQLAAFQ
jgi:hypothetical protein